MLRINQFRVYIDELKIPNHTGRVNEEEYELIDRGLRQLLDNKGAVYSVKKKAIDALTKVGLKDKIYSKLSPGERTRLAIIKLALLKTNVLILDEVTNHLDKEALNLIYELIRSYEGTIISISHNRKYNEILDADVSLNMGTGVVENLKLTKNL